LGKRSSTRKSSTRRSFAWDVTFNGAHNSNKLKSLGIDPGTGKAIPPIINTTTRQIEGYPINGYWQRPSKWADTNGDNIITPNEVTVSVNGRAAERRVRIHRLFAAAR
jgi:hypothetical protein